MSEIICQLMFLLGLQTCLSPNTKCTHMSKALTAYCTYKSQHCKQIFNISIVVFLCCSVNYTCAADRKWTGDHVLPVIPPCIPGIIFLYYTVQLWPFLVFGHAYKTASTQVFVEAEDLCILYINWPNKKIVIFINTYLRTKVLQHANRYILYIQDISHPVLFIKKDTHMLILCRRS